MPNGRQRLSETEAEIRTRTLGLVIRSFLAIFRKTEAGGWGQKSGRGERKEGRQGGRKKGGNREEKKDWNGESKIKRPKEETRVERWRRKRRKKIRTAERETQEKESQGSRSAGEGTADKDTPKGAGQADCSYLVPQGARQTQRASSRLGGRPLTTAWTLRKAHGDFRYFTCIMVTLVTSS